MIFRKIGYFYAVKVLIVSRGPLFLDDRQFIKNTGRRMVPDCWV